MTVHKLSLTQVIWVFSLSFPGVKPGGGDFFPQCSLVHIMKCKWDNVEVDMPGYHRSGLNWFTCNLSSEFSNNVHLSKCRGGCADISDCSYSHPEELIKLLCSKKKSRKKLGLQMKLKYFSFFLSIFFLCSRPFIHTLKTFCDTTVTAFRHSLKCFVNMLAVIFLVTFSLQHLLYCFPTAPSKYHNTDKLNNTWRSHQDWRLLLPGLTQLTHTSRTRSIS